ncbi:MAG: CPBP family intramembrane metalloprotease [Actinomycetota bacterium]|nr:CPBP family intramembrane metalloprotease [Actinomycetota bacterium]
MSDEPVTEERPSGGRPIRWGLGEAVAGYLVAFTLLNLVGSIWYGVTGQEDPSLGSILATLAALWAGLVGATILTSRFKGSGSLREDYGFVIEVRDVLPGLAAGVACQGLVLLLYLPFTLLNPDLDVSAEAKRLLDPVQGPGLALLAVCLVVGAPLVEELFFRGLLQRALGRRAGPGWAVAGSSLAFGLTHYQPLQLLGLLAFGVVLGLLAQRTGRLGPGIMAHAAFNATAVVLLAVIR